MKTIIHSQQILINHNSKWLSRELEENEKDPKKKNFTTNEHLEDACWNGVLNDLVPEICTQLPLSEINETDTFLELKFGDYALHFDPEASINPYVIVETYCEN